MNHTGLLNAPPVSVCNDVRPIKLRENDIVMEWLEKHPTVGDIIASLSDVTGARGTQSSFLCALNSPLSSLSHSLPPPPLPSFPTHPHPAIPSPCPFVPFAFSPPHFFLHSLDNTAAAYLSLSLSLSLYLSPSSFSHSLSPKSLSGRRRKRRGEVL